MLRTLRNSCTWALAAVAVAMPARAFWIPTPLPTIPVVEYHNIHLDHYFLTATPQEMDAIERGSAGPGWTRTGWTFGAYPAGSQPSQYYFCRDIQGGPCGQPVARFYGTPGLGPNSHFYTADMDEAAKLKVPGSGWTYERDEFAIELPSGKDGAGECAPGLTPVYRLYNNGFALGKDSNHRYVTDAGEREKMRQRGWIDEGVRFCAYGAALGPIESYRVATALEGKIRPSAQCEDEALNRGACVAVNNLPAPSTRYHYPNYPPDTSAFFDVTGTRSNYLFVADTALPSLSEFVQGDSTRAPTGEIQANALFGIRVDSSKRFAGDLSSINPLYQFHTTVAPGAFDDRFFPWTGHESPTELRVSFTLNVKTIDTWSAGSQAYGHPTLEFIDTKSGHHLYFTVGTYGTRPDDGSDLLAVDSGTGKVIVGTTFRASSPYLRSMALATLYTPPGFVSPNDWGWGGPFEFRMNRDEFQRVLDDARRLDAALSSSPDDYILDNFHFNNEVYRDGVIGLNLADYKLEVWKR
jgi:hypothetical protein